ncbi:MAG: hypothetical protein U0517_03105 [Candidatus Andersenbacteria bacterium]
MEKAYEISGGLNTGREELYNELKIPREEGKLPVEGELSKTPDHLEIIEMSDALIQKEFQELGLLQPMFLAPERVHYFSENEFQKHYAKPTGKPNYEVGGYADIHLGATYISVENPNVQDFLVESRGGVRYAAGDIALEEFPHDDPEREKKIDIRADELESNWHAQVKKLALLARTMHEALHLASFEKYYKNSNDEYRGSRSGYYAYLDGKGSFASLNEAITEKIAWELVDKKLEMVPEGPIEWKRDTKARTESYDDDRYILDIIVEKIAAQKQELGDVVWRRFKMGYLSGRVMHLRDIERTFGKGALRMYAELTPETVEKNKRVLVTYFESDDPKERAELEKEIREKTKSPAQ